MELSFQEKFYKLQVGIRSFRFFKLVYEMSHCSQSRIKHCFKRNEQKEVTYQYSEEEYANIRRDYLLISSINLFSLIKDEYFAMINNSELQKLDFDFEHIFVNRDDSKRFSRKQIINYIRNAFNHSNENHLFKFINPNMIEICLEGTNPPFHVLLTQDELYSLAIQIMNQTKHFCRFDIKGLDQIDMHGDIRSQLKNILVDHCYTYGNQIKDEEFDIYHTVFRKFGIQSFQQFKNGGLKNHPDLKKIQEMDSITYQYYEYQLSDIQVETIYNLLQYAQNQGVLNPNNPHDVQYFLEMFIRQILPFGMCNADSILGTMYFCQTIMQDWNLSLDKIFEKECEKKQYHYDLDYTDWSVLYWDEKISTSFAICCNFILSNYARNEIIEIDGRLIELERLRNSFVHGRWSINYDGDNKFFTLYDAKNGLQNESQFHWCENFSIDEMIKINRAILNQYYDEITKEQQSINRLQMLLRR